MKPFNPNVPITVRNTRSKAKLAAATAARPFHHHVNGTDGDHIRDDDRVLLHGDSDKAMEPQPRRLSRPSTATAAMNKHGNNLTIRPSLPAKNAHHDMPQTHEPVMVARSMTAMDSGSDLSDCPSDLTDLSDTDDPTVPTSPPKPERRSRRNKSLDELPSAPPLVARSPALKRPSTATLQVVATASASNHVDTAPPDSAREPVRTTVQDVAELEGNGIACAGDASLVVQVDDILAAGAAEPPCAAASLPVSPHIESTHPDLPETTESHSLEAPEQVTSRPASRTTRSSKKALDPATLPDLAPLPGLPLPRRTRARKTTLHSHSKELDGVTVAKDALVAPDATSSSSTSPAVDHQSDEQTKPPAKKLKAKSNGPGRLPTVVSTQADPIPLAKLKKLPAKTLLAQIKSLLAHSDPDWIVTAQDAPLALLDSMDWVVNEESWQALPAHERRELLEYLPLCDRNADGTDLVAGFWSNPAVVHQGVVYTDYMRAGVLVPILADSVRVEGTPSTDIDGDIVMDDAALRLPKPISELRIMKAITGDLDPASLPASDPDRSWLVALFGDGDEDDAWKDENFERFWGDLDESLMRANRSRAGDSANVTLQQLFAAGMLKVGDRLLYRRKWTKPLPVAIELEFKIKKFQVKLGSCTTTVVRESFRNLSDATPNAKPTTKLDVEEKVGEELSWRSPNQLESAIWAWISPGSKRPNGNAWRDLTRVRNNTDGGEDAVPLFKLRHDYLDEQED